jgi:hypothetical protein
MTSITRQGRVSGDGDSLDQQFEHLICHKSAIHKCCARHAAGAGAQSTNKACVSNLLACQDYRYRAVTEAENRKALCQISRGNHGLELIEKLLEDEVSLRLKAATYAGICKRTLVTFVAVQCRQLRAVARSRNLHILR